MNIRALVEAQVATPGTVKRGRPRVGLDAAWIKNVDSPVMVA